MRTGKRLGKGAVLEDGKWVVTFSNRYTNGFAIRQFIDGEIEGVRGDGPWYELLDFEPPAKPEEPQIGEVWEVSLAYAPDSKRALRVYNGEENDMRSFEGVSHLCKPSEYTFHKRWVPANE